ncbi:unnamed protein product [Closterium sp. NIES-64]|nr:unnamed protein product [Closterium sp. NIES-64]
MWGGKGPGEKEDGRMDGEGGRWGKGGGRGGMEGGEGTEAGGCYMARAAVWVNAGERQCCILIASGDNKLQKHEDGNATTLQAGPGIPIDPSRITRLSWQPRAFLYSGFLSHDECDHLITLARDKVSRSSVADNESGKSVLSEIRTSSGTFLNKYQDDIVKRIEERIAAWTFLPKEHGEAIQILKYEIGQKYEAHFDYFFDSVNTQMGGHRVATVLMYLTTVEAGGETVFPNAQPRPPTDATASECANRGLAGACARREVLVWGAVKPQKGDALFVLFAAPGRHHRPAIIARHLSQLICTPPLPPSTVLPVPPACSPTLSLPPVKPQRVNALLFYSLHPDGTMDQSSSHPQKGDALLFYSLHPDGTTDQSSLHASCPVIRGEKWSATKWIHVRSFEARPLAHGCEDLNPKSLLPAQVLRNLSDKLYDKRKAAALEIETAVKAAVAEGNDERINAIISLLANDYATSAQPNQRKGGLIGLAAVTVGLGPDARLAAVTVGLGPDASRYLDVRLAAVIVGLGPDASHVDAAAVGLIGLAAVTLWGFLGRTSNGPERTLRICRHCKLKFVGGAFRCAQHITRWKGLKWKDVCLCKAPIPSADRGAVRVLYEGKHARREGKKKAKEMAIEACAGGAKKQCIEDFYGEGASCAKESADDAICLMWAALHLPEHLADHPLWRNAVRCITDAGHGYVPPKRRYVGGAGLARCREKIERGLAPITASWKRDGVTIGSDMMTDKSGRPQANILLINDSGAVFTESIDCMLETKTGGYIASVLRPIIEKVGLANIVALCMDGGSNYAAACRELMLEYPHIEHVLCATHVMDLLMEDIGKMDWAKDIPVSEGREGEAGAEAGGHQIWHAIHRGAAALRGAECIDADGAEPGVAGLGEGEEAAGRALRSHDHGCRVVERGGVLRRLLKIPFVVMRKTDSTAKGMMGRMYDLMLQLTEDINAKLEEEEAGLVLSSSERTEVTNIVQKRWDHSMACAMHVVGRILNPVNQEEGIFRTDLECTRVFKVFVARHYAGRTVTRKDGEELRASHCIVPECIVPEVLKSFSDSDSRVRYYACHSPFPPPSIALPPSFPPPFPTHNTLSIPQRIVPEVLKSFSDSDSRVRYYACEALYNIAKVTRGDFIVFFNDAFNALCKLSADLDPNVQSAAHLLDRLVKVRSEGVRELGRKGVRELGRKGVRELGRKGVSDPNVQSATHPLDCLVKDIVTVSDQFSIGEFIPLLRAHMSVLNPLFLPRRLDHCCPVPHTLRLPLSCPIPFIEEFIPLLRAHMSVLNPFVQQFLVGWITVLDSVPDIDMLGFLPDLLDVGWITVLDSVPDIDMLGFLPDLLDGGLVAWCVDCVCVPSESKSSQVSRQLDSVPDIDMLGFLPDLLDGG